MKKILIGVALISLIILGYYLGNLMKPKETKGGIALTLVVRQYRDGKLINEVVEKKDPFTNNFVQLLWSLMKTSGSWVTYTMTDVSGTSRNLYVSYYNDWTCAISSGYTRPLCGQGGYIYIGDGTTAFSINDYKLSGTNILKAACSAPSESIADPKINYTISASFSLSSANFNPLCIETS